MGLIMGESEVGDATKRKSPQGVEIEAQKQFGK